MMPANLADEAVPGNIRRAEHFAGFLSRFVEYLKVRFSLSLESDVDYLLMIVYLDSDACTARCGRDTFVIPAAFEGYHIHRTETFTVRSDVYRSPITSS